MSIAMKCIYFFFASHRCFLTAFRNTLGVCAECFFLFVGIDMGVECELGEGISSELKYIINKN